MRRILIVLGLFSSLCLWAQRVEEVCGESLYYAPSTMTLEEAKRAALWDARAKLIEKTFGTFINRSTSVSVRNDQGAQSRSESSVITRGMNEVRGEWIEDTREPVQEVSEDKSMSNTIIIRTKIWGKIREISEPKTDIRVSILKDTLPEAHADVFRNERPFYIYLKSPVSGYVAIYLVDEYDESAYCLLPTLYDAPGAIPVEAGREYILFSEKYAREHYSREQRTLGTGYILTANQSQVINTIYVIFSPNEFSKADDVQQQDKQYQLPRQTGIKDFDAWMTRCKMYDPKLVVVPLSVKIVK